ncbi:leucine-rich repeat protein [Catenibacterium mitsuokai]|uniref:leucine-rich repeat protein n=8 Tax=Catenibacterium mitsuokai TaxID=100886 RepID=UPI0022E6E750|nr:leucine-rich repeat protein [Catenibacterium mitsuokai]
MLKKLLAVIMSLSMVISVASFRINSVEALGNQYRESRDVFVADCVINGLLDKSGNRANTFSLISSTITHKYTYKALAEALMDDQTLVFNSAFWNTVNKSLKGEFSTVFQQRRLFYETILMDYLAYVDHSEEYKSSFNQDCAKYEYDISKKLVEVAGKNYKNSVDEIIKNQSLSDAIEFSDKYGFIYQLNKFNGLVSSIKEEATSAKDYYDALKSALAIKNANVSRIAFLKQMKKVASDNTDFCDAVDEIIGVYEGNYASIILDGVGYTAAQHLTDWAWGELLELLPSAYSAALKAIKLGQKTLDFIFNSNDTAENNLKLLILYIIGNYARESATNLRTVFNGNQTASNGSDFVNGYLEYVIYQKYATELASGYVQESTYDGLWNQIKNSFNGTDTTYAQFKKYFEDDISISKNYINQVVNYYNLHNSYYGDFTDKSSEIVDSGTSNDMSWNLNGNGVLTISGTGNMPDYSSTSQPWYKYRESIKQVKIGDGITGIGDYAFSGCKSLEELTIPEGVKKLGTRIIADTYIEKIKIPSTVAESNSVYIFNTGYFGALGGDAVLTEVEFAEGMTKIPSNICYGANTVEKITIPSTVTSIGSNAFNGCSSLKGLTLPAGLTKLEDYAFSNCNSLTSITVPKSVTSIGNYAFENCTSLKSAVIEANGKKLFETEIRDYAFSGCTSLTSVTIPGNVTSIGDYAFSNCNSLVANVYKNSTGLIYCKNNKIDYRIVGSYDKKHYIQIENGTCTNIDENTELKVSQLKEGNDYDVVSKSFGNFELYDLSFYKDDQKVTIDGTAIVRIPLKEGMDGSKCKVYYNDNGTFTDMGAVYKDGYMEFETNHFSQYVVAEIESSTFTLGDVNEDDKVDFLDAIVVLRHDAEIIQLTDNQMKAAEVNKDGKVDFLDAIMILRYDAEIINSFN